MKRVLSALTILFVLALVSCNQSAPDRETKKEMANLQVESSEDLAATSVQTEDIKPEYLTVKEFKEKVWNFESNPEQWVYEGDLPCVVDFYADWCKPCKMVAPIMDDLADYYDGRVKIYKVNTDKEKELSSVFQIRSIPSVLFSPKGNKPAMQAGAMSKEQYISIIDEFILGIKKETENNKKES